MPIRAAPTEIVSWPKRAAEPYRTDKRRAVTECHRPLEAIPKLDGAAVCHDCSGKRGSLRRQPRRPARKNVRSRGGPVGNGAPRSNEPLAGGGGVEGAALPGVEHGAGGH